MTSSPNLQKVSKLKGWGDIARFLESTIGLWSVDTLRRMSERKRDPLPVQRIGARVIGDPTMLTEWARRQVA